MNLEGRIAVVTGGSTGIGFAIARRLAASGCRVAICARTESDLQAAADALREEGHEVLAVPADVSREEDVTRFAERVGELLGPADVLVNNAGVGAFGPLPELTPGDFDRAFGVNARGLFLCSLAFVPEMVRQRDGVIVNIASIAGKVPFAGGSVYAGSKHAAVGISKCMMLDLRPHNVRVITVCPGSVDTPFFRKQEHLASDPMKMLRAEDVADLVVSAIRLSDRGTVSDLEIRPVSP
ncbi:MAG: SDR family oxidoreductase [Gemmatimonadota bacterium]